jgi:hypothetical protein
MARARRPISGHTQNQNPAMQRPGTGAVTTDGTTAPGSAAVLQIKKPLCIAVRDAFPVGRGDGNLV